MENNLFMKKLIRGGIAIRCNTKREAKGLLNKINKAGLRWKSGCKANNFNPWDWYGNDTCIHVQSGAVMYCELDYFVQRGFEIREYKEVKDLL